VGSSHILIVSDYPLYERKGMVDPIVMTIFRESDKQVFERRVSEAIGWVTLGDDSRTETAYVYSNTVANIKQRLAVMGFSLGRVRQEFYEVIKEQLASVEQGGARRAYLPEPDTLESATFEDWIEAFGLASQEYTRRRSAGLPTYDAGHPELPCDFLSFPCNDFRSFLRAFLETCPDDASVTLDITVLVANGYYSPEEPVCVVALDELSAEYVANEKIVILTEGSTDSLILGQSLRLLYPHLAEYYSFMDFGLSNAAGGASVLVSSIKAIIGAGISNRVVALFDNDTAAQVAMRGLRGITIPDNVRILRYPDLELCRHYPTMGPGGVTELDVNGLACSVELYLGVDVLTIDGQLMPVQWKGYDASLGQYQGEILDKKRLHEAFLKKVGRCNKNRDLIENTDWESMELVLQAVFDAFS
jgi:hypothetical protein